MIAQIKFGALVALGVVLWFIIISLFAPLFIVLILLLSFMFFGALALKAMLEIQRDKRSMEIIENVAKRDLKMATRWVGRS